MKLGIIFLLCLTGCAGNPPFRVACGHMGGCYHKINTECHSGYIQVSKNGDPNPQPVMVDGEWNMLVVCDRDNIPTTK